MNSDFHLIAGRRYRVYGIYGSPREFIAGEEPIFIDYTITSVSLKRVFRWCNPATWFFREKIKQKGNHEKESKAIAGRS